MHGVEDKLVQFFKLGSRMVWKKVRDEVEGQSRRGVNGRITGIMVNSEYSHAEFQINTGLIYLLIINNRFFGLSH